jgi:hypothetical protein
MSIIGTIDEMKDEINKLLPEDIQITQMQRACKGQILHKKKQLLQSFSNPQL